MVRRYLVFCIGYERHLRRLDLENKVYVSVDGVALDVEFCCYLRPYCPHVGIPYVPFVGPWVYGDAVGAEHLAVGSHPENVGMVAAPCVAQCGHLVNVNA